MQQAFPDLKPEIKQRLEAQGLKPFTIKPIPNFINPHSQDYWGTNLFLGLVCFLGRYYAGKQQSIRILWSTCLVAIPYFAVCTSVKLDDHRSNGLHRKTLEERLDYNPITRRAWQRALTEVQNQQNQLRQEIQELEFQLAKRS